MQLVSKRVPQVLGCGCPKNVVYHGLGCLQAPTPFWMDSAGLSAVGQLATCVRASSCFKLYRTINKEKTIENEREYCYISF